MEKPKLSTVSDISYPFLPEEGCIKYVDLSNEFMQEAERLAREESLDKVMPVGCVVVRDRKILGRGANGSTFHDNNPCERIIQNIPTGQGYELCAGCHPKNHGEPTAIADALTKTASLKGAEMYLWGHWWCCEPCWKSMLSAQINTVYLLSGSEILFNKNAPGNIVGKQFID